MCELARVNRSGYYRQLEESAPDEAAMAMRTAIREIVLTHHRRYGYRRVVPVTLSRPDCALLHRSHWPSLAGSRPI